MSESAKRARLRYEIAPLQLAKREIVRPKYKVKADRSLASVLAPAPERAVPGGYASAGPLWWVVIAKYLGNLAHYRQQQTLARRGAAIPRATPCDWIRIAADRLEPIYKSLLRRVDEGD